MTFPSNLSLLTAVLCLCVLVVISQFKGSSWTAIRMEQNEDKLVSVEDAIPTSGSDNIDNRSNFDTILWPRIQQKLCPSGIPNLSLGAKLFEMAREEFGIANATNNNATKTNDFLKDSKFFDGSFGFTLLLDKNDPGASLLYARISRCGSAQIQEYMESQLGPSSDSAEASGYSHHEFLKTEDLQEFLKKNHNGGEKPCLFTVLRDPIDHFLSGYNDVEYRLINNKRLPRDIERAIKDETLTLPDYSKIPYKHKRDDIEDHHNDARARHHRAIRFETFVQNLLEEHDSFVELGIVYAHLYPLSRILPTLHRMEMVPTGKKSSQNSATTSAITATPNWILPTMANLIESVPEFLSGACPRVAGNYLGNTKHTELPPMTPVEKRTSWSDPLGTYKSAEDVWKRGDFVAKSLCHLHAFDYACFYGSTTDYGTSLDAEDIPATCRNVFGSDVFRELID